MCVKRVLRTMYILHAKTVVALIYTFYEIRDKNE